VGIVEELVEIWPNEVCDIDLPPLLQLLRLNSKQGQNSLLLQTSLVNGVLGEPSSTPAYCICTWPWSSSPAIRKKSSGPSPSSRMDVVTPQVNFLWKITFDMLYTNKFLIRVRSRALSIPSEPTTI